MVIYDLLCINDHSFEGWFKNKEDLEDQKNKGLLRCPVCGTSQVQKKLTASKVTKKSNTTKPVALDSSTNSEKDPAIETIDDAAAYAQLQAMLHKAHRYIDKNYTNVGNKFADEALKIHRGEKEPENIRGMASKSELKELAEEGVSALPLPPKPVDKDKLN